MTLDIFSRPPVCMNGPVHVFLDDPDPGFDHRWTQHPEVQATTAGIFETKTGWTAADLEGKTVLDAGCGCGRFSHVALAAGAAQVVAVDASMAALTAAAENCKDHADRLTLAQADLLDLPILPCTIDMAFSIGVLHHTRVPQMSFGQVAATVKPGGQLSVWVYAKPVDNDQWLPALDFLHDITKACPPKALYDAIKRHGLKVRDSYAPGNAAVLSQILRVSGSPDVRECWSDTFDWHAPQYRFWHHPAEVRGWFKAAGFRVTRNGEFPVCVTGTKD